MIGGTNDIGNLAINDGLTGTGAITLSGVGDISTPKIGITGTVDIGHTSTGSVTLNGTAYNIDGDTTITTTSAADKIAIGDALTIKTAGDKVEFVGGGITLNDDGHDLTITAGAGNVTLTDIGGHSSEVIDIEGATVTAAVIGNADEIKSVKLDGSTKVVLGGNITTSNTTLNKVEIVGDAELGAGITIDTSANNGLIDFSGKIDSDSNTNIP